MLEEKRADDNGWEDRPFIYRVGATGRTSARSMAAHPVGARIAVAVQGCGQKVTSGVSVRSLNAVLFGN